MIVESGNDYIGALKGNQSGLLEEVQENFTPEDTVKEICKGHGRIEKRTVRICQTLDSIREWPGLKTLICVDSERQVIKAQVIEVSTETRYYISSFSGSAQEFAERIRAACRRGNLPPPNRLGYWGVENKVHYVRSGDSRRG